MPAVLLLLLVLAGYCPAPAVVYVAPANGIVSPTAAVVSVVSACAMASAVLSCCFCKAFELSPTDLNVGLLAVCAASVCVRCLYVYMCACVVLDGRAVVFSALLFIILSFC